MNTDAAAPTEALVQTSQRIAQLLDEVRALVSPAVWERVESLMQSTVELYGGGLARIVERVTATGLDPDRLEAALIGDELVASLLTLHGLHPHDPATRIRTALSERTAQLGRVELISFDAGVARLEVGPDVQSRAGLKLALEQLVIEVAPEVQLIDIAGLPTLPSAHPGTERLVQIDLGRSRA